MAKLKLVLILAGFVMSAHGAVITFRTEVNNAPCPTVTSITTGAGSITQDAIADCNPQSSASVVADTEGPGLAVSAVAYSFIYDITGPSHIFARAAATERYMVVGGSGAAVLRLDYDIQCSGNPGGFYLPVLEVSDGSSTQTNPGATGGCYVQFWTGTLLQSITPNVQLTILMDTGTVESAFNDVYNLRSLRVAARILDANGLDVPGASLVAIPEPGTLWLVAAGLGALLLRRRP